MAIHHHTGHRSRLKKRFLNEGLDNFELHNVVELLLFYAMPQRDTNQLAHTLIEEFGSLSGILDAGPQQLMNITGVGEHTATLLSLIPQVCRRYYQEKADIPVPKDNYVDVLGRRLVAASVGRMVEVVYLFCFDNRMKELYYGVIGEGILDTVNVVTRKVAEIAIRTEATCIVLGHNHPTGFALPSAADRQNTLELRRMLAPLSIRLLDHIVVAGDDFVSMAQSGYLSPDFLPG